MLNQSLPQLPNVGVDVIEVGVDVFQAGSDVPCESVGYRSGVAFGSLSFDA